MVAIGEGMRMESFLGEIRLLAYSRIPRDFLPCEGQVLPIVQNQALFALLGSKFGGDGRVNFALPDLRGRAIVGATSFGTGTQYPVATAAGVEGVTLTMAQMPPHSHGVGASTGPADSAVPIGAVFAQAAKFKTFSTVKIYTATSSDLVPLHAGTIGSAGVARPHDNMQPFAVGNYCICVRGPFPSRAD